jgi:hypothetical protein
MFLSRRSESQQTVLTYIFVVWDAGLVVSQTRQDESPVSESDSKCRQWHVLHQPHGYLAAVQQIDQVRSMEERLIATKFSFEPFMTSLFGIVTGEDVFSVPAQAQDSLC